MVEYDFYCFRILGPQWHDDSKRVVRAFPYIRGGHYITSQKAPRSISGAGEAWHGVCYECGSLTHSFEMPPPLWCCLFALELLEQQHNAIECANRRS